VTHCVCSFLCYFLNSSNNGINLCYIVFFLLRRTLSLYNICHKIHAFIWTLKMLSKFLYQFYQKINSSTTVCCLHTVTYQSGRTKEGLRITEVVYLSTLFTYEYNSVQANQKVPRSIYSIRGLLWFFFINQKVIVALGLLTQMSML